MMRRRDPRLLGTGAVLAACVLLAGAGLALVASRHGRTGSVPTAAASPTPTPSAGSPSPAARTASPSPTAPRSSPAGPSPSPAPGTGAGGLHLVPGPYGFQIPQGWTVGPVQAPSATVQRVHVSDPASSAGIDYLSDATAAIYNPDHTVNLAIVGAVVTCKATSSRYVPNRGPRYACAPEGGLNVSGAILIQPYPQGFKLLQVKAPPQDDQLVEAILSGFHA